MVGKNVIEGFDVDGFVVDGLVVVVVDVTGFNVVVVVVLLEQGGSTVHTIGPQYTLPCSCCSLPILLPNTVVKRLAIIIPSIYPALVNVTSLNGANTLGPNCLPSYVCVIHILFVNVNTINVLPLLLPCAFDPDTKSYMV